VVEEDFVEVEDAGDCRVAREDVGGPVVVVDQLGLVVELGGGGDQVG
jgi:hypothetical protein